MQAVENYEWDNNLTPTEGGYTENPDVHIKNAREMWCGGKIFTTEKEAYDEAHKIFKEIVDDPEGYGILEYGICLIEIPRKF
jgi:hypothetical protein